MLYNTRIFEVQHLDGTPWTQRETDEFVRLHCSEINRHQPPFHFEIDDSWLLWVSDVLRHMERVGRADYLRKLDMKVHWYTQEELIGP